MHDVNATISGQLRMMMADADPQFKVSYLLAIRLAEQYESGGNSRIAELLLTTLDALLATPKSRKSGTSTNSEANNGGSSALAKLRAAHGAPVRQ